jgi:hypothetical protein
MRIYRVVVDSYPEGSDEPGWRPANWEPFVTRGPEGDEMQEFSWPPRKNYFSYRSAYDRMLLFERYGASAHVEISDPVTWSETINQQGEQ